MSKSFDHGALTDRRRHDQREANHLREFFQEGSERQHERGVPEENFLRAGARVKNLFEQVSDFYFQSRNRHARRVTAAGNQNDERAHDDHQREQCFDADGFVEELFYLLSGGDVLSYLVDDIKPLQERHANQYERQNERQLYADNAPDRYAAPVIDITPVTSSAKPEIQISCNVDKLSLSRIARFCTRILY